MLSCMCKSGFYHTKTLSSIKDLLDKVMSNTAAHGFITSKLDYGNSLLFGLPTTQLHKLQLVQNAAARVMAKVSKYDRITKIHQQLHCLPLKAMI